MTIQTDTKWCIACNCEQEHSIAFFKDGIPILKCAGCGLGRADAGNFDPSSYYDENYFSGNRADGYADYQATEKVLRAEFQKTIKLLKSLGASDGNLLELGCAYGFFLLEARKYYDVYGIEICVDAVEACQARGLGNVFAGVAGDEELERIPQLDVLVMLDVIEHLESPDQVMKSVASKLKPGGVALLTTGDFSSIASRVFGKHWRLMTPPQHLWYFTPEALRRLGRQAGMEPVSVRYPSKFVPLSLIFYQLLRPFKWQLKLPERFNSIGVPVNTFDAMQVVFRKSAA